MKSSRFTTEQIIGILQEHAAGTRTAVLLPRHGISLPTLYAWTKKYGDLQVSEAKRLRETEDENARLKRLAAEQALNLQILQDVFGKGR
jgi:putative transposase